MNINELKERLDNNVPQIYTHVLINGKWGIGKTYFVKEYLKDKKYVYVSLFGVESLETFKTQILIQLYKAVGIWSKINKELSKAAISLGPASFSIPYFKTDVVKYIKKKSKEGNLYIVIDDIERKSCKIEMSEILGVIEEFKEIENVNIIMIANQEEIDDKVYTKFKEKVIQKTYNITEYSDDARKNILNKYILEITEIKNTEKLEEILNTFYRKHKLKNLRTMEKSLIFLKYMYYNIDFSNLTEQDIKNLIIVSLAVVIEMEEKLYISIEEQRNTQETIFSEQLKSINGCIIKNYLNELVIGNNKQDIIEYILNIYNDINSEENFRRICEFFDDAHKFSESKTDEPLFYKSEEELRLSIQKFYELNIKNIDVNLNINNWFKKFAEVYIYSKKINLAGIFNEEEIKKCIENYVSAMKSVDISNHNMGWHRMIFMEDKDEFLIRINEYIDQCMLNKYYLQQINLLEKSNNENAIEELLNIYQIENVKDKEYILNILKEKRFFIPDLNSSLTETTWGFAHTIWSKMNSCREKRDTKFEEVVKNLLKVANTIGTYRIESLNNQYKIDINEMKNE